MHASAVGVVGARGEGSAAGVAWTKVGEAVVAAHRLHVSHPAFAAEIAGGGEIYFERFAGGMMC